MAEVKREAGTEVTEEKRYCGRESATRVQ